MQRAGKGGEGRVSACTPKENPPTCLCILKVDPWRKGGCWGGPPKSRRGVGAGGGSGIGRAGQLGCPVPPTSEGSGSRPRVSACTRAATPRSPAPRSPAPRSPAPVPPGPARGCRRWAGSGPTEARCGRRRGPLIAPPDPDAPPGARNARTLAAPAPPPPAARPRRRLPTFVRQVRHFTSSSPPTRPRAARERPRAAGNSRACALAPPTPSLAGGRAGDPVRACALPPHLSRPSPRGRACSAAGRGCRHAPAHCGRFKLFLSPPPFPAHTPSGGGAGLWRRRRARRSSLAKVLGGGPER